MKPLDVRLIMERRDEFPTLFTLDLLSAMFQSLLMTSHVIFVLFVREVLAANATFERLSVVLDVVQFVGAYTKLRNLFAAISTIHPYSLFRRLFMLILVSMEILFDVKGRSAQGTYQTFNAKMNVTIDTRFFAGPLK